MKKDKRGEKKRAKKTGKRVEGAAKKAGKPAKSPNTPDSEEMSSEIPNAIEVAVTKTVKEKVEETLVGLLLAFLSVTAFSTVAFNILAEEESPIFLVTLLLLISGTMLIIVSSCLLLLGVGDWEDRSRKCVPFIMGMTLIAIGIFIPIVKGDEYKEFERSSIIRELESNDAFRTTVLDVLVNDSAVGERIREIVREEGATKMRGTPK